MLEAYRNTPVAVEANGLLPFAASKARRGCAVTLDGGAIRLRSGGMYQIVAGFSFAATAEGAVTVSLQIDGETIDTDTATVTASAAGDTVHVTIPSLICVDGGRCGCAEPVSVSYAVSAAGTLVTANATAVKVR